MKIPLALRILLLVLAAALLSGCGAGSWWQGKWTLDRPLTEQKFREAMAAKTSAPPVQEGEGIGGFLRGAVSGLLEGMLLSALDNRVVEITDKEIISMKDGAGTALNYEVMSRPDKDSVVIKQSDGEVQTWRRVGEHLVMPTTGDASFQVYFRRVEK